MKVKIIPAGTNIAAYTGVYFNHFFDKIQQLQLCFRYKCFEVKGFPFLFSLQGGSEFLSVINCTYILDLTTRKCSSIPLKAELYIIHLPSSLCNISAFTDLIAYFILSSF